MRSIHWFGPWTLLLVLLAAQAASSQSADPFEAYAYQPDRIEPGTVYTYLKSNLDGTNPGNIALYIATPDHIESFKWHRGQSQATLVTADMDWDRFSVRRFESWRVLASGERMMAGSCEYQDGPGELVVRFGEQTQALTPSIWPWHSYDFDFASLNFVLRHVVDPEARLRFGICDVVDTDDGPFFANKGAVTLQYIGDDERNGVACRKYRIDGPGLYNQGGFMWVRSADRVMAEYQIKLPDEDSYDSAKLVLQSVERLSPQQWNVFMTRSLGGAGGQHEPGDRNDR